MSRAKINSGAIDYLDVRLSHVAQMAWEGFFGHLDVALVEADSPHGRRAVPGDKPSKKSVPSSCA